MSARSWRLDPLEFVVLWEQFGPNRLPYPLQYRARSTYAEDHHHDRKTAAASVQQRLDDNLYRAVATLIESDTHCAAYGLDAIGTPDERVVRAHVGIRGRIAALARQRPGHQEDAGGAIDLELVSIAAVPGKLAAALPKRAAGKGDVLVTHPGELAGGPLLADAGAQSSRERLAAMLRGPRRCAGEVTVCRAQETTPTAGFAWHDCDDGRYLIEHDSQGGVTIRPGSAAVLATRIRATLNVEPQKEHP